MMLEVISIPAIATIVYWVMNILKYTFNYNEKFKRLIPLLSALLGGIIGAVSFYTVPSIVPASHVVVAIVLGGASGLTATGANQILKQMDPSKKN